MKTLIILAIVWFCMATYSIHRRGKKENYTFFNPLGFGLFNCLGFFIGLYVAILTVLHLIITYLP